MNSLRKLINRVITQVYCWQNGHVLRWVRDIYGDQIIFLSDGNRSEWRCERCGCYKFLPTLHDPGELS
jgi:hypothetical protein